MNDDKKLKKKLHENKDDLAGEHRLGDIGQMILLIIFLIVWIIDSFFIKYSTIISDNIPVYIRIILSLIVLTISGYIAKSGLDIVFGEVRKKAGVIRKGVFNLVRHPIYLSAILFYLSLLIFSISFIGLVIFVIIIGFYYFIAKYEERLLIEKFGKEYENYMKEIHMFIPRLKK